MHAHFFFFLKKVLLITVFASLLLSVTVPAKENLRTSTIEVIGTGKIFDNNISKSRRQAINNGLTMALDLALSDIIAKDTLIHNFQSLNQIFYEQTDQYITYYKVLAESSSKKNYKVMVQATVSLDRVEKRLIEAEILIGKITPPQKLKIIIKGTDNLSNFIMLRRAIESMPAVTDVQIKEMKSDEVTTEVLFKGSPKELADALMLKTFVMFGININEISGNHLKIKLISS